MIWGEFYEEMDPISMPLFPRIGPSKHYYVLRQMNDLQWEPQYGWIPCFEGRSNDKNFLLSWNTTDDIGFLRDLIKKAKEAAPGGWLYVAYQRLQGQGIQRPGKPRYSVAFFLNTNRSWSWAATYKDDLFRCAPPAFLLEAAAIEKAPAPLSAWDRLCTDE